MPVLRVAALLFLSGACALTYQIVWQREFRLIFGASTAASAAVLAIFVGGLGAGSLWLGPRADRRRAPLLFYARLETLIALSAALTPPLLDLVRAGYVTLGGTPVLGSAAGSLLRLVLAALVLAVPTVLMGGTLPAAARSLASEHDQRRRGMALLYAANTLGAVVGSFLATFYWLEALGDRRTLWLACGVNLLTALLARALARTSTAAPAAVESPVVAAPAAVPAGFVLSAACVVGMAFFLMELVWYRMLAPLLGGSVFTFGLILTLALLGIGLGGAAYTLLGEDRPASLRGFATTCLAEAACIALPLALGDRLAVTALLLRPFGALGFSSQVASWAVLAAVVVLPTAFVAGVQFPLLVGLLGRGREALGRQLGQAYAWNTAGAIVGSLLGGFGLLPMLGAPGTWRLVTILLVALGVAASVLSLNRERQRFAHAGHAALAALAIALCLALGPTAAWRHSGIGAGRASPALLSSTNGLEDFLRQERRTLVWEVEGRESSVAIVRRSGMAFAVNGKIDGHFTLDAPTQVMGGLIGAALHPGTVRSALVVGLGTGSSGGWLAAVPGIERVDVVELEPGTVEVARRAAAVNHDALGNPKLRLQIGDAREVLLAGRERYDVIFSEPSNPYRAGIASLFTREFYRAARARLREDGLFVQWVQSYDVTSDTVARIYATLGSEFPWVETWRTHRDLLLIASNREPTHSVAALRARLASEPFASGLRAAWQVSDLEGFLGHFVAGPSLARRLAVVRPVLNSDDRNALEFGFARAVGLRGLFEIAELRDLAREQGADRARLDDAVDQSRVDDERRRLSGLLGDEWRQMSDAERARYAAYASATSGDFATASSAWSRQPRPAQSPIELGLVAEGRADQGDEKALEPLQGLRTAQPVEADAILARLRLRQGQHYEAGVALEKAFVAYRTDPWPRYEVMLRALQTTRELLQQQPRLGRTMFRAVSEPFAAGAIDEERRLTAFDIATVLGLTPECARALDALEPWVPWRRDFLERRLGCYEAARDPRAAAAKADLAAFASAEPERLSLSPATK